MTAVRDITPQLLALPNPELHAREAALARDQVQMIRDLALRLRELEGFKHVILFSQGFHVDRVIPSASINVDSHLGEQHRAVTERSTAR